MTNVDVTNVDVTNAVNTAMILCGGRSSRMGRDKCWLPVGEITLLRLVCDRVAEVVNAAEIIVVAAADQHLPSLPEHITIVRDTQFHQGPLAGIAQGLSVLHERFGSKAVTFVTACDAVALQPNVIRFLFQHLGLHDAAVPVAVDRQGQQQQYPLCAVYRTRLYQLAVDLLNSGERRARSLANNCHTAFIPTTDLASVDPGLLSLSNLNSPEDYHRFVQQSDR